MKANLFRLLSPAFVLLCAWCLCIVIPASVADDSQTAPANQPKAVTGFIPLGPSQVAQAKERLCRAADALAARLAVDGENGRNWAKYLKLDSLRSELAKAAAPDLKKLDDIYTRFSRDYDGLELVWFVDLKLALGRYLNVTRAIDNPEIEKAYKDLTEKTLPSQLEIYKNEPSPAVADDIGYALGWLSDFCQAEDLVSRTREQFARPNLFINVSDDYVAAAMGGPVDETAPITDVILGTCIQGTGKTKGRVTIELVPCDDKAIINTVLAGTTESNNTGYNGPVCIFTTGLTTFEGRNQLIATADGIQTLPATSQATTSSTINSICTQRGGALVQRMAWRRAYQQKCTADAIAAQHAQWRINRRMDNQAAEAAGDANKRYEEKLRGPLAERNAFAEQLVCSTTKSEILIRALRAAYNQLAASSDPPELAEPADVAMRVHQSAINNTAMTLFAGRVVTEEKFLKTIEDTFGEVPEEFQPEQGKAEWIIHFANREPLTFTFAAGGYTVSLHAVGYEREGEEYPGANVSASYKIEKSDKGFVAMRQGEIEVYPPGFVKGQRRLSAREQTLRKMLKKRFAKVFPEKYVPKGYLEPKGRWKKAGRVPLSQWSTQDGWMTMGWKLPGEEQ